MSTTREQIQKERERAADEALNKANDLSHDLARAAFQRLTAQFKDWKVKIERRESRNFDNGGWRIEVTDGKVSHYVHFGPGYPRRRNYYGRLTPHMVATARAGTYERNGKRYTPNYEHSKDGSFPLDRIVRDTEDAMKAHQQEREHRERIKKWHQDGLSKLHEVLKRLDLPVGSSLVYTNAGPLRARISLASNGRLSLDLSPAKTLETADDFVALVEALRKVTV